MALLCIALASCLVVSGAAAVAAAPGGSATTGGDAVAGEATQAENVIPDIQEGPDPDATVTRIGTAADGTANWTVTIRMRLDSNDSAEEFEAFRTEFERNRSTYLDRFRDRMAGVVENAEAVTEREMNATAFDAAIGIQEVPRRWGYVTYRFRWEGFAAVAEGDVVVGDVFRGGLFLEADDILLLEAPTGYSVESADPTPDWTDGAQLQWTGPVSFEDQRPRTVFSSGEGQSATDTSTPDGDTDGDEPDSGGLPLVGLFVAVVAAAGLAAVGAAYVRRRGGASNTALSGTETHDDGNPERRSAGGSSDGNAGVESASTGEEGANTGLGLDELATDEDRVLALLEAEDGRIRQAEIADRLDWSASKTSRVVSRMAEDGEIEKLRLGRENVIDLASEDGDP